MKTNAIVIALYVMFSSGTLGAEESCPLAEAIETVAPEYPMLEAPKAHSGYAVVQFTIDNQGAVMAPKVIESGSEPTDRFAEAFGRSAIVAIKKWKFEPQNVNCVSIQRFSFELSE